MPATLTNLVVNPSLETNASSWSANGGATLTRVSTQQQSGAWSLQVACTAVANSGTQCAAITAGVGAVFSTGVYLRGNVGGETVDVQLRNQAGTVVTTRAVTLTTAWQWFTLTGTTPGSTTSIHLRVNKTAATAHTYFLDAAIVTAGGTVWPAFDGDTPGAAWTGTAHASTSTIPIASGPSQAAYAYLIDWLGDDYTDPSSDVSSRLKADPVSISYGRDSERALSPTAPGEASYHLDNDSRDYSPDNPSSPLAGSLKAGRPARIEATANTVTYTLFDGFIDDFQLDPQPSPRDASFTFIDALARVSPQKVSTALYQGLRTGDAIGVLLDAVGWPADKRDLDPGATQIRWWWGEGNAGDELEKLVNSEGPGALVAVTPGGDFMFRDRHHRIMYPASLTSQAVFRVTGQGSWSPLASWPLGYDHGAKSVVNNADFAVGIRTPSGTLAPVWTSDEVYSIADGDVVEVTAASSDPFRGAEVPVVDVDFTATGGGNATVVLSRDSGQAVTIRIGASGGSLVIRGLQLRAFPVPVVSTVKVFEEDVASVETYGARSWPYDVPWANQHDARAIAQVVVGQRAERLPAVQVNLANYDDVTLIQQLSRDLSDRVTVIDAETGINGDFHIEQIKHQIHGSGERVHETTFACERTPEQPANLFTFDVAGKGFNDGVFGRSGINDPDTVFLFDGASGHRFDEGVFAW
jgi:hypothetical protein